jgi:hypothetical protein
MRWTLIRLLSSCWESVERTCSKLIIRVIFPLNPVPMPQRDTDELTVVELMRRRLMTATTVPRASH